MQSKEIRQRFLNFFAGREHAILPSASLVPENDPSVLFTTAGMQPLVPYLLGETHPAGKRLVNVQKCVRTQDIEEVGDKTHDTFFEMLGNWSLGDYFKEEAIKWSWELMTDKGEGFGLDPKRLYVTVFAGDENAPRDDEAKKIWMKVGVPENRIYFLPADKNWWQAGENGPCGPDTEMYYDITGNLGDLSLEEFKRADDAQKVVEIWNDVFMEYLKKDGRVVGKLAKQNVDTGAGLERFAMVLQGKDNIFDTDLFAPIMAEINSLAKKDDVKAKRIVADHVRTAVFMVADGVTPSNTDRGYILRRLIRRAVRYASALELPDGSLVEIARVVVKKYEDVYDNLRPQEKMIISEIEAEEKKFMVGLKRIKDIGFFEFDEEMDGRTARYGDPRPEDLFELYTTYGLPPEMVIEELQKREKLYLEHAVMKEKWLTKEKIGELMGGFHELMKKHQDMSRAGAEQKFKGGLADTSEQTTKYHTATHMLGAALRQVLGAHVGQKGSNITAERLRFDFSHETKMTDEEKRRVEDIVNEAIARDLPVTCEEMPLEKARQMGAIGAFGEKYADVVKVYRIGTPEEVFSLEICGGPHVARTGVLGRFKITKEEAVSAGVRRIKATLE